LEIWVSGKPQVLKAIALSDNGCVVTSDNGLKKNAQLQYFDVRWEHYSYYPGDIEAGLKMVD